MKGFLFWLVLLAHLPLPCQGSIVGNWFYYQKIYRGHIMPEPPEATLRLYFSFSPEGESRLFWWNEGSPGICERKGAYFLEGNELVDRVVWVNPKNAPGCSSDPDMQLGRVARTPVSFNEADLFLHLHIGDDPLIYVWKRVKSEDQ